MDTFAYCTREQVKRALDQKITARDDEQLDRCIVSGRGQVESLTNRRFYPWTGTRYFDWPNQQYARSWRLWLDGSDLISVTTFTSGGTLIPSTNYFLRRGDNIDEPPYSYIEIDISTSSALSAGSTHQRSAALAGVFGASSDEVSAGVLAEALDASETGIDVSDSTLIGVGDIIRVDSERMIVTDKVMLDTTVDIAGSDSLTASTSDVSLTVSTATNAPVKNEIILIDSERMLVVDVAGTVLTLKRAWDGTVLATHAAGAGIFAPRTLTVQRGALGTTAATHTNATAIVRNIPPSLVQALNMAEAINFILQENSGYARTIGSGDNQREAPGRGLNDLRKSVYAEHGKQMRTRAV